MAKVIATLEKNSGEEIRIELDQFKGFDVLSMWVWRKGYHTNEPIRTRKGLVIQQKLIPDLMSALEEAYCYLKDPHMKNSSIKGTN